MNKYLSKLQPIFLTLILAIIFVLPNIAFAQEQPAPKVYLTVFYGDGCSHCAKEEIFLDKLEKEFPSLVVRRLEVWYNQDNVKIMKEIAINLNINVAGVPLTVIGDEVISGYLNDQTTGARIRGIVESHLIIGCADIVGDIVGDNGDGGNFECEDDKLLETIDLPFFGEVETKKWSLPILTIAIAAIDGFNPCAMWVLLFLVSLLLGMENKKKMWTLGIAFIVTSSVVYFFFLTAWLNLFLFLGFISIIRIIIGIVAIGSGGYHLREWYVNKSGLCKVTDQKRKQKIMDKFKQVTEEKKFWLALVGIISIAIAVNMIELVCSAGLPAIYTQVLALSDLSVPFYYLYLLLYIFVFMLDDLAIFVIAMTTLQVAGLSGKYSRWSNLLGGIIILILGILLIFKPGWVMFG